MALDALLATARGWLAQDPDPETAAELSGLIAKVEAGEQPAAAELADAFDGTLQFGTAGLRGRLGPGSNRMNRVVVAPRAEAARSDAEVGAVNWLSVPPPQAPLPVEVQVRYRSAPVQALLTPLQPIEADLAAGRLHRCRLEFAEEQFSITPGQAAVFYAAEVVLGGGLIQA
jgi:hypothetical protein